MARGKVVEHGPGYRPQEHDVRRPVRIAALERLKSEHGIVPGMPAPKTPRGLDRATRLEPLHLPGRHQLRQLPEEPDGRQLAIAIVT
jgi:hypothetical protein